MNFWIFPNSKKQIMIGEKNEDKSIFLDHVGLVLLCSLGKEDEKRHLLEAIWIESMKEIHRRKDSILCHSTFCNHCRSIKGKLTHWRWQMIKKVRSLICQDATELFNSQTILPLDFSLCEMINFTFCWSNFVLGYLIFAEKKCKKVFLWDSSHRILKNVFFFLVWIFLMFPLFPNIIFRWHRHLSNISESLRWSLSYLSGYTFRYQILTCEKKSYT